MQEQKVKNEAILDHLAHYSPLRQAGSPKDRSLSQTCYLSIFAVSDFFMHVKDALHHWSLL